MATAIRFEARVPPADAGRRGGRGQGWPPPRSLATLVEGEIIPRLMVAHASPEDGVARLSDGAFATATLTDRVAAVPAVAVPAGAVIAAGEAAALAPLALRIDADALLDHVDRILRRGVSIETMLVDLLAPAARQLGLWWEEDRCDFVEVTMGLWRLQEVVHEISARLPSGRAPRPGERRRALFAAMPGEQHSLGTVMVGELFGREGWAADVLPDPSMAELLARVAERAFDLIGLTVSSECNIARVPSAILALRSVSRNPRLTVMVGGQVFVERPELAADVGADGTAADARVALATAAELVDGNCNREVAVGG